MVTKSHLLSHYSQLVLKRFVCCAGTINCLGSWYVAYSISCWNDQPRPWPCLKNAGAGSGLKVASPARAEAGALVYH